MTYVPDGHPFQLKFGSEDIDPNLIAVGWLDGGQPYAQGQTPTAVIRRLVELCREGVNRTRGFHRCNLCVAQSESPRPRPTTVSDPAGEFLVGSAEIRVRGLTGQQYAAPDMIIHYVIEHGYLPPEDFCEGVLSG